MPPEFAVDEDEVVQSSKPCGAVAHRLPDL